MSITITLTPEQETWIRAQVSGGAFASVEEAARRLIDDAILARELGADDLDWALPLIAEARTELARGEGVSLKEHNRRIDAPMASFSGA